MPRDIRSKDDLTPDARNANLGTERGRYMLEQSIREVGAYDDVVILDDMRPRPGRAYIYVLVDPIERQIRYVGKANDPYERLRAHYWGCLRGQTYCQRWMASLKRKGIRPILGTIDMATEENWRTKERFWVAYFRAKGAPLTNITDGGNGGPFVTPEETKARMRTGCSGWHQSESAKQRISRARKGMVFPQQHRERLSQRKKIFFADERNTHYLSRHWAAITDEQAREVRRLAIAGKKSQREIGEEFGIPQSTVSEIKYGKRYKHAFAADAND